MRFLETMDLLDTDPKKYVGPDVDPKTGKFKCNHKNHAGTPCFIDQDVHLALIPDEKEIPKTKEDEKMKKKDEDLFTDDDFALLSEGHGSRKPSQEKKGVHKGKLAPYSDKYPILINTIKGDVKHASMFGRIKKKNPGHIFDYVMNQMADRALNKAPKRSTEDKEKAKKSLTHQESTEEKMSNTNVKKTTLKEWSDMECGTKPAQKEQKVVEESLTATQLAMQAYYNSPNSVSRVPKAYEHKFPEGIKPLQEVGIKEEPKPVEKKKRIIIW